jgi:hypothetical protein
MRKRVAVLVIAIAAFVGSTAAPAAAEEIFDCEGNIALACPGPVPW